MATSWANGTLTISKAMTSTLAQRLIVGVLGAANIDTAGMTNAQKLQAFDDWLWPTLKANARSWEERQAAAAAGETAETELP